MSSSNIFAPIEHEPFPEQIPTRGNHPVHKQGINGNAPIQTNKFYANFFLGNRNQASWTHPYSVAWSKGGGVAASWGIAISHIEQSRLVYGDGNPSKFFFNPVGIQSVILSARELGNNTVMTTDTLRAFSANVNLSPQASGPTTITFPLVQGMGFVTGIYNNATPLIQSGVFFKTLTFSGHLHGSSTVRYIVTLEDGTVWLIFMSPNDGSTPPTLTLASNSAIVGARQFSGAIQVSKNPNGNQSQAFYDECAGSYPLRGSIAGSTSSAVGTYQLSWTKGGNITKPLLMFALPHHQQQMSPTFSAQSRAALQLQTTTKGMAAGVVGDIWTLTEHSLPYDMGFAPWTPQHRSQDKLSPTVKHFIRNVSAYEIAENINAQTNLNSMYFSGKGLAKFAFTVYAAQMANCSDVASAGLLQLKNAFSHFVNNTQIFPLVYDNVWGGIVSSCSYTTGDPGCDFGNTFYNDHHFHYGYFVYTAAVIGALDPQWLQQGTNRAWVNTLVRDYANPVSGDARFPFSRNFDWYHGHSWAHGLYESADGKDQESSSEDGMASYAIKMWGHTIHDANMEARGNMMLAIQARAFRCYYLLENGNTIEPPRFVGNKAIGILFENKMDHTTYFGNKIEYIEGIHMIPLNPSTTLTRTRPFVQEEWQQYFSNGRADQVQGGWRGILYANLATVDPKTAWNFFAQDDFKQEWLDGGASRTWYLVWCAALGGAN